MRGGVGFPELLEGELSMRILSLSLSDSSLGRMPPAWLRRRRHRGVCDDTSGLRVSDKLAFGARRLGRRKRNMSEPASSPLTAEGWGKAKAEDEDGNDGRRIASGMGWDGEDGMVSDGEGRGEARSVL